MFQVGIPVPQLLMTDGLQDLLQDGPQESVE
jgi:hypothetical protein